MTNKTNNNEKTKSSVSKAASTMSRKDSLHEEKSRAASELNKTRGEHSHAAGHSKSH